MSDFLRRMASSSHLRAEETRERFGERELEQWAASARPPRQLALSQDRFDVIAEVKVASPSEGRLLEPSDSGALVVTRSVALEAAGPVALSILTEPESFGGAVSDLEKVTDAVETPVMRKDFLVDPIQVLEARALGASGVLLIARMVDRPTLVDMTDLALELGMFVLVEIFEGPDLHNASAVFDREVVVGVNARDLSTLAVDRRRHARLAASLPADRPRVAESGLTDEDDAARIAGLGYDLALVGTALSRSRDPGGLLTSMIRSGRAARGAAVAS